MGTQFTLGKTTALQAVVLSSRLSVSTIFRTISSVGQSARLLNEGSGVQVPDSPPIFLEHHMSMILFAKIATFACFGYWAIATTLVMLLQLFKPEPMHGKVNLRKPRDLMLISALLAWVAMWCFRSMYQLVLVNV